MHPYSIENLNEKKVLLIVFLVLAVSIFYSLLQKMGIIQFLETFEKNLSIISPFIKWGFISIVLTPISIFWTFYEVFNKYLWKLKLFNKIIGVPNINGNYEGCLQSNYIDKETGKQVPPIRSKLEVVQKFDKIKFCLSFPDTPSSSKSNMGGLREFDGKIAEFAFSYSNTSRDLKVESTMHDGMNILRFNLETGEVEGEYFNNRGINPNKGIMNLKKII